MLSSAVRRPLDLGRGRRTSRLDEEVEVEGRTWPGLTCFDLHSISTEEFNRLQRNSPDGDSKTHSLNRIYGMYDWLLKY